MSFVMSGAVVGGGTGGAVEERKPQASNAKGKKSGKVRAEFTASISVLVVELVHS